MDDIFLRSVEKVDIPATTKPPAEINIITIPETFIKSKNKVILKTGSFNNKEIVWTQRSWLEESSIIDFNAIEGDSLMPSGNGKNKAEFIGLGKSTEGSCVIDGDGSLNPHWWNCIGVVDGFQIPPALPGPNGRKAYRNHLYIWKPGD